MSGLTLTQKAALIKLFNCRTYHGKLSLGTGSALVRKGYVNRMGAPRPFVNHNGGWYVLNQAGIRYNQTGKMIGE